MRAWLLGTVGAALLLGCGPAAPSGQVPPPPPASAALPPVKAPPALGDGKWGDFVSRRFGVRVPLPDGKGWRIDDHGANWLSATHPASGSTLLLRAWREDDIANRQRCEERARLWRKLPERRGADIVEKRPVNVPPDFDTVVEVGVMPAPAKNGKSAAIDAFAMAFGARVRRCFAYVFTTSASGQGAEGIVGERLATMVQGSLEKLSFESGLEPRIEREPLPEGGAEGR